MSLNDREPPARRLFLRQIGSASGAAALATPALLGGLASPLASAQDTAARPADTAHSTGYLSLGPQEAACVEAIPRRAMAWFAFPTDCTRFRFAGGG